MYQPHQEEEQRNNRARKNNYCHAAKGDTAEVECQQSLGQDALAHTQFCIKKAETTNE